MRTAARPAKTFARTASGLAIAWVTLLALMSASLGSAYLPLGIGNVVAGLGIAAVKAAIVGWWFMQLRHASAVVRLASLAALFVLAMLVALSGVDYRTRAVAPAPVQAAQQIEPLLQDNRAAHDPPR